MLPLPSLGGHWTSKKRINIPKNHRYLSAFPGWLFNIYLSPTYSVAACRLLVYCADLACIFTITFNPMIPSKEQENCHCSRMFGPSVCIQGPRRRVGRDPNEVRGEVRQSVPILHWPLRSSGPQVQSLMIKERVITPKPRRDSEIVSKFKNRRGIFRSDSRWRLHAPMSQR